MAFHDVAHVAHVDGHAVFSADDDVGDLLQAGDQPDAVHEQRFAGSRDQTTADVGVVPLQCINHIRHGEVVFQQIRRIEDDLILPLLAAPAVDLGHPFHTAKLWLDGPVLNGP